MKKLLVAAAALVIGAGAAMADPLEGLWRTAKDDHGDSGLIKVAPCGNQLCGKLIKSFDSSGKEKASTMIGRNIISETQHKGGGIYKGKVYAPDRDKTYSSKLRLSGDTLDVSGCVFGICRNGGTWKRVN
ncbi:hypothetical protein PEL8287_02927 [Roseovarius litorisediminis]|uniref:DUF2147 domain-containing protein n=1 Tax=Roseovarius litorisediminis TaxID=1312363 RepID=A0A1Y5T318_9RHOB|nr:DUF2147 domain-containing protein [Roseovarius litorisediminis]SLN54655.1 hypothetical protein PEL8287_02927 [Roseovarius litorisediminis]